MSLEEERLACWARFQVAADAWINQKDAGPAKALIERVRGMYGDRVAEQQARELRNWVAKRKGRQKPA